MKDFLKRFPVFVTLFLFSMSPVLTSCGNDDDNGDDGTSSPSVSSVEVSYSVSLSDAWYKYYDVELSYTPAPGQTTTETLEMDKEMKISYKYAESPDEISLKIVAKPKANLPEIVDDETYELNKSISLNVAGVASNGSGNIFVWSQPVATSMATKGSSLRKALNKERTLYDQSYTLPK